MPHLLQIEADQTHHAARQREAVDPHLVASGRTQAAPGTLAAPREGAPRTCEPEHTRQPVIQT
jgi:hypothetical protein